MSTDPAASSATTARRSGLAASCAVAAAAGALAFTRVTSPDLGFQIATGRAVRALGGIPANNVLSFTQPDHPWLLHEWLPALLFELAWRRRGPEGVLALKLAVIVATWSIVLTTARRLGASPMVAALASVLGAGAASVRFTARPQIFSNLALAGVCLLLATAARAEGRARVRLVVAAGIVAALTAQVHAGALTSYLLLSAVAAGLALEPLRARLSRDEVRNGGGTRAALRLAAVTAGAAAVAVLALTLYHPHGARPLLVPFQHALDRTLGEHIVEYRSPLAFDFLGLHLYWVFAALCLIPFALARRMGAPLLLPVATFGALSLRHVRTIDSFAIVAAPVLALGLHDLYASRAPAGDAPPRPRATGVPAALLALLTIGLPLDHWRSFPAGAGLVQAVWPAAMFRFIEQERLSGPAFVSDAWAGPFLGEFYPRERAFFDPRFEAYSMDFVLGVYQLVRNGGPGWDAELDRYGVQLVLLRYTSPAEARRQGGRDNLRQLLARSPAWVLVSFSDTGELFVRRDGPNARSAERLAIPGIEPDRGDFLVAPALTAVPLLRAIDAGSSDNRVLTFAAIAAAAAGDGAMARSLLDRAARQRPDDPRVDAARSAIARSTPPSGAPVEGPGGGGQ